MPKIRKKTSKRVSTKQRVKVQKKIREHHRKSRRDAKKDTTWRSKKRQDPGIPNSFPYKEQLLNEIEQRRMQAEQQRIAAREAKSKEEVDEDNDDDEEGVMDDGVVVKGKEQPPVSGNIVSTRASTLPRPYTGTLAHLLAEAGPSKTKDLCAVVVLLDARDPGSWRIPHVESALAKQRCQVLYGLTRVDLVPREPLAMWMADIEASTKSSVFALCSPAPAGNGKEARPGAGIDALVAHIEGLVKTAAKRTSAEPSIALLGIENSGRTHLAGILAASLPQIVVYDTPAILPASSRLANLSTEEQRALMAREQAKEKENEATADDAEQQRDRDATHRMLIRNAGGIFKVREPLPLIGALLRRVAQESDLMMAFNTPAFIDMNDFLISVARASGRLKKGAVPDIVAAARSVLFAWSTGQIGYYAQAPSPSPALKKSAEHIRQRIESDKSLAKVVLPRKEWRQKWSGKEVRLTAVETSMLGADNELLAFAKPVKMEIDNVPSDDAEDEDEDTDFAGEGSDEDDDLDAEDDDVTFDEDEEDEGEDEDEDEE